MPVFYLDTSALVKRYRTERGTEVVEALLANPLSEDRFFISFLSIIELTSGVLRLAKGGQLLEDTANEILARFRRDVRELFRVWPIDDEITADASRRLSNTGCGAPAVMVSSDRELLDAAAAAGLGAFDPQIPGSAEKLKQLRRA